jgi:ASCH domain
VPTRTTHVQEPSGKGLIIDEPWISLIVTGEKTWEARSRNTNMRGRIGLIGKGAKTVIGLADLIDTLPKLPRSQLRASFAKHRVPASEIDEDFKWSTAWVLQRARSCQSQFRIASPVVRSFG